MEPVSGLYFNGKNSSPRSVYLETLGRLLVLTNHSDLTFEYDENSYSIAAQDGGPLGVIDFQDGSRFEAGSVDLSQLVLPNRAHPSAWLEKHLFSTILISAAILLVLSVFYFILFMPALDWTARSLPLSIKEKLSVQSENQISQIMAPSQLSAEKLIHLKKDRKSVV